MKIGTWIFAAMGISLAVTLVLELAWAWLWKIRERRELLLVAAANLLTNPAVVACYYLAAELVLSDGRETEKWILWAVKGFLEISAAAAEAFCYQKCSRAIHRPWLFSISANLFSYWAGVCLQNII